MLRWVWLDIGHRETNQQPHTLIRGPQRMYEQGHCRWNIRRIYRQRISPSLTYNYPENESQTVSKGSSPSSAVTSHLLSPLTAVQVIGLPYFEYIHTYIWGPTSPKQLSIDGYTLNRIISMTDLHGLVRGTAGCSHSHTGLHCDHCHRISSTVWTGAN